MVYLFVVQSKTVVNGNLLIGQSTVNTQQSSDARNGDEIPKKRQKVATCTAGTIKIHSFNDLCKKYIPIYIPKVNEYLCKILVLTQSVSKVKCCYGFFVIKC